MTSSKDPPILLSGVKRQNTDQVALSGLMPTVVFQDLYQSKNNLAINHADWDEIIIGQTLTISSVVGVFSVSEEIRAPDGDRGLLAIGKITAIDGLVLTINTATSHFIAGQTITGGTSGATATIDSIAGTRTLFDFESGAVKLLVNPESGSEIIRQTRQYFSYGIGHTRSVNMSLFAGGFGAGIIKTAGIFDDDDGFFVEVSDNVYWVLRDSTSGIPVNQKFPLGEWNIDNFDGDGPSGIDLALTGVISVAFIYDYQGNGFIYYGVFVEGQLFLAHRAGTESSLATLVRTPTLPLRHQTTLTSTQAELVGTSQVAEVIRTSSSIRPNGFQFNASMGIDSRTVLGVTIPIFAIRLKNSFNGNLNRRTVQLIGATFTAKVNEANICIALVQDAVDVVGNWVDVHPDSAVEFSTDISDLVGRPVIQIASSIATDLTGLLGTVAKFTDFSKDNHHSFLNQNISSDNSEMFVFYAQSGSANPGSEVRGGVSWIETD